MTVETQTSSTTMRGNGATTNWVFNFYVEDSSHLIVERQSYATGIVDKVYAETSEYTITGVGDPNGGTVTLLGTPLSSEYQITIRREVPYKQELDITNQGGFYPETLEDQLDLMEMQIQQIHERSVRAILRPSGVAETVIPAGTDYAYKFLSYGADGKSIVLRDGTGTMAQAFRTRLLVGSEGQTVFTLPWAPLTDIFVYINGSLQEAGTEEADGDYLIDGSTLTLNEGAHLDDVIVAIIGEAAGGALTSSDLAFSHGHLNLPGTIGNVLSRWVSPSDAPYNAVGDGVADDTTPVTNSITQFKTTRKGVYVVEAGDYLHSGSVYNIGGLSFWFNDGYTGGVNPMAELETKTILLTAETEDSSPLSGKKAKIPLGVTVTARGAHHASGVRSNLNNYSTDGNGNTAFYGAALSAATANWSAALHGETKHGGGTTIAGSFESASYTASGSFYGVVSNNTSNGAAATHPLTGGGLTLHPTATAFFTQGSVGSGAKGAWKYGYRVGANSMRTDGDAVRLEAPVAHQIRSISTAVSSVADILLEANSAVGAIFNGIYTSGIAVRVRADQAIGMEITGTKKFSWLSASSRFELTGGPLGINGNKVLGDRDTGWATQTATPSKANLGASPTVGAIAQYLSALDVMMKTHGFIGA